MNFEYFFRLSDEEIISILPDIDTGNLVCALSSSSEDNIKRIINIIRKQLGSFSAEIMEDQIKNSKISIVDVIKSRNSIAKIVMNAFPLKCDNSYQIDDRKHA